MSLVGRVAVVTGSARGLGRAIALKLAAEGADVIVHGRTPSAHLDESCREVQALGRRSLAVSGDLRRPAEVASLVAAVAAAFSQVDILVNNAALGSFGPALSLGERGWGGTLEASLSGAWRVTRGITPLMTGGWGRIINVSSLGARRYLPGYGALGAAKAGLESLTRTLAVELAPRGIVVNGVAGGMMDTGAGSPLPPEIEAMRSAYLRHAPGGGPARPEDLADVVALLCREEARWIVGQTLVADGGFSLI